MNKLNLEEVNNYVSENIAKFHKARIERLDDLKLSTVLKRKNPYLYKAKNILTADQIVREIVDAHISSNEETLFGNWLEGLAIFINNKVYGGYKSGIHGVDLEFDKENCRYIVSIKSGPNWGNSSQIKKMTAEFKTAQKVLRTSNSKLITRAVNGCCYGKENNPDKGDYFKYCGQEFWSFISGDDDLYIKLIKPLGTFAKERNEEFQLLYANVINKFTHEFYLDYCNDSGEILWDKIVKFNSGIKE